MKDDIKAILRHNGPSTCGQVAKALMIHPREARAWLDELRNCGEIQHNWAKGVYSL